MFAIGQEDDDFAILRVSVTDASQSVRAQIDSGGIQRVDGVVHLQSEGFVGIQFAGAADKSLGQVGVDAPVTRAVGVGQGAVRDRRAKPQVIELVTARTQADVNGRQTFAEGHLGKGHGGELIPAAELADLCTFQGIDVVPSPTNTGVDRLPGKAVHSAKFVGAVYTFAAGPK